MKYVIRFSNPAEREEVLTQLYGEVLETSDNMLIIESDYALEPLREIFKNQIVAEYLADWDWRIE